MSAYSERFPVGSKVRVAGASTLARFLRPLWKYHHPVDPEHVRYAGVECSIKAVSFYHGGDVLYELDSIPGKWHEDCIVDATCRTANVALNQDRAVSGIDKPKSSEDDVGVWTRQCFGCGLMNPDAQAKCTECGRRTRWKNIGDAVIELADLQRSSKKCELGAVLKIAIGIIVVVAAFATPLLSDGTPPMKVIGVTVIAGAVSAAKGIVEFLRTRQAAKLLAEAERRLIPSKRRDA